jgi:hypothetical protein
MRENYAWVASLSAARIPYCASIGAPAAATATPAATATATPAADAASVVRSAAPTVIPSVTAIVATTATVATTAPAASRTETEACRHVRDPGLEKRYVAHGRHGAAVDADARGHGAGRNALIKDRIGGIPWHDERREAPARV